MNTCSPDVQVPESQYPKSVFTLLCLATAFYRSVRFFTASIKRPYLLSLGFLNDDLLKLQAFYSLALAFFDIPVSIYADKCSRKPVLFLGLCMLLISYAIYSVDLHQFSGAYGVFCLLDILEALGRNIISSNLDSWVIQLLSNPNNPENQDLYHKFLYTTQKYSAYSGIACSFCAILIASYWGYRLCFGIGLSFLTLIVGLFSILVFSEKWGLSAIIAKSPTFKPEPTATLAPKALGCSFTDAFNHLSKSVKALFCSSWGRFAIGVGCIMAVLRYIVFHYWEPALFAQKITPSPKLDRSMMWMFIFCHAGMYGMSYILNELLGTRRRSISDVNRTGPACLILGACTAATLAYIGIQSPSLIQNPLATVAMIASLSTVHGCLDISQILTHRLLARSAEQGILSSCISLIHFSGRLFSACILTYLIKPYMNNAASFYCVALGYCFLLPLLYGWTRSVPQLIPLTPPRLPKA